MRAAKTIEGCFSHGDLSLRWTTGAESEIPLDFSCAAVCMFVFWWNACVWKRAWACEFFSVFFRKYSSKFFLLKTVLQHECLRLKAGYAVNRRKIFCEHLLCGR